MSDLIDFEAICKRTLNDEEIALEMLRSFRGYVSDSIMAIQDCWQDNDLDGFHFALHSLIGASATAGCKPVKTLCEQAKAAEREAAPEQVEQALVALKEVEPLLIKELDTLLQRAPA